jgi:hypothetical protein
MTGHGGVRLSRHRRFPCHASPMRDASQVSRGYNMTVLCPSF